MEIQTKKTITELTQNSVSVLTQRFIIEDEIELQVGENHRCAYINSKSGRIDIVENEPKEVSNSVLMIWGSEPTIIENEE